MYETYKFYIKMDGQVFGPYTAAEVRDLDLLDDIMVTEESMNGEWLEARRFDFDDMARKERPTSQYNRPSPPPFIVNPDGSVGMQPQARRQPETEPEAPAAAPSLPETPREHNRNRVPEEISGWNWGAFFFNWLWGIFNGVYWPLIIIVLNFVPYVGGLITLGICIALGINGNEWAWKGTTWESVEHFKRVQHNWAIACLWALGVTILFFVIAINY